MKLTELPPPVAAYFRAANAGDTDALVGCFAPGATVHDEGGQFSGAAAIAAWNEKAAKAVGAQCAVETVESVHQGIRARAEVSGAFPGSPIHLNFLFSLGADGITRLEITP